MSGQRKTKEHERLAKSRDRKADWKNWGPYVSERAWGTVREHYRTDKSVWSSFPFAHAHKRAYRWNEDGIAGFCNRLQNICLTHAFWNGNDPILKERLYGMSGDQGNHGEDVKEYYYYLDGTPTHSYMKMLYKYPQAEFPYQELAKINSERNRHQQEFELIDALRDELAEGRYFDIFIEYAKGDDEDILCRVRAINRGPDTADLHILPHLFFRNTWSWGYPRPKPTVEQIGDSDDIRCSVSDRHLGQFYWHAESGSMDFQDLLFCENETNPELLSIVETAPGYHKDAINQAIVNGVSSSVNPLNRGTKAAAHFASAVESGASVEVRFRFSRSDADAFSDFDQIFESRIAEADEYYDAILESEKGSEERLIQRQALAGLLWTKQFYHYSVELWSHGDPDGSPLGRVYRSGRNSNWQHLYNLDVLSMPDKWEYPWYAAWDLAFHMIPTAMLDPEWAKRQLILLLREWYMHPNGQLPAYEWSFGDTNPPVHAWGALRVFQISQKSSGKADYTFLERVFHKLLLNFTWWVNQKDKNGNNIFEGGFLGLDNIGVFDRSQPLPTGGYLEQADGTAWMAMYSLNMLEMAIELALNNPAYEDVATKFFEHFVYIAHAINDDSSPSALWDDEDGFYYDSLVTPDGRVTRIKIRSFVGLTTLFATSVITAETLEKLPRFRRRLEWFLKFRPALFSKAVVTRDEDNGKVLLSLVDRDRLERILGHMLDEDKFLSPFGLRSLSREHKDNPYLFTVGYEQYRVDYEPAESTSGLFGGNSNWRGPVWLPINYLMIESLYTFDSFWGEGLKVTTPDGAKTLAEAAEDISNRLKRIFKTDEDKRRPFNGGESLFQEDEDWKNHILFYEYFHGENGAGLGASHQTGWTALVANLIQNDGKMER